MMVLKRGSIKFLIVAAVITIACCVANLGASSLSTLNHTSKCSNTIQALAGINGHVADGTTCTTGFNENGNSTRSSLIHETSSNPTLTNPTVSPSIGSQTTYFTFTVIYTNPYNTAPNYVQVEINSNWAYNMQADPHDFTYSDGCVYSCTIQLPGGYSNYWFACFAQASGLNIQTGTVTGPIVSPVTLSFISVSPSSGDTNTQFTFSVQYADANDNAPSIGVMLAVDSNVYSMTKQNPQDYYYTDGCIYTVTTSIAQGSHWYHVYCYDERGSDIQSNSTLLVVQAASIITDPGPTLAIVLISAGAFLSIFIPAMAHNIRMKKPPIAIHPMASHTPSSGSNMVPVMGMLPRSAFVQQPLQAVPSTRSISSPPAVTTHPVQAQAPPSNVILPGTPKWARLARFDILQYTAQEDTANPSSHEGEQGSSESTQDGIRIAKPNVKASFAPETNPASTSPTEHKMEQVMEKHAEQVTAEAAQIKPETDAPVVTSQATSSPLLEGKVFHVGRAEFEKNVVTIPAAQVMLSCAGCGTRIQASGMNDGLVYFCKKCHQALVIELSCPKCFGKTKMTQDELFSSQAVPSRCPVCFEPLVPE
ncbi:MAG TPA: hypothetical protein VKM55_09105 [Candidatus Lokiarchaeia archaeon]|nr:hypothetical protein [Candidatus Lokiarchaeia archaeon]